MPSWYLRGWDQKHPGRVVSKSDYRFRGQRADQPSEVSEPDLFIEDLRGFRDAYLADDQARVVRNNPNVAVVAVTERANDLAEVVGILHLADRKRLDEPLAQPNLGQPV